ncbi:MAG: ABC transporter permease [Gemmatimonadetes bacterium]|nr:ABC transporter permease [Gemmatimonadota bacterium]
MGGALLARAVTRATSLDFGYSPRGLYWTWVNVPAQRAPLDSVPRMIAAVLERARHAPGVQSAATLHWAWPQDYMIVSDAYNGRAGFLASGAAAVVSPDYLRTLGIPVLRGRNFLAGDEVSGAVILDEDAARELFGGAGEDAVGRTIKLGDLDSEVPWIRVVGIARRALILRSGGWGFNPYERQPLVVYIASDRYRDRRSELAMRVEHSDAETQLALRRALRDPEAQGSGGAWIRGFTEFYERELRSRRFIVGVFVLFASLSLLLAAVGLYGVLAYAVSRRMREFAVRVALGAEQRRVLRMVMHDGAVMLLAGTGIGAFAAMWAGQLLDAWLYDVYFVDVLSLVAAELVLLAAGLAACLAPALRATRANPVEVLRAT